MRNIYILTSPYRASVPQPNYRFNADANTGHGFAIFMASVGTLRPIGLRRRLTWALGIYSLTRYACQQ